MPRFTIIGPDGKPEEIHLTRESTPEEVDRLERYWKAQDEQRVARQKAEAKEIARMPMRAFWVFVVLALSFIWLGARYLN